MWALTKASVASLCISLAAVWAFHYVLDLADIKLGECGPRPNSSLGFDYAKVRILLQHVVLSYM